MNPSCIFCKIIAGTMPATVVADHAEVVVIRDITPKAPTHLLIIPKKHVHDVAHLEQVDLPVIGTMFAAAQQLAQSLPDPKAFRLVVNNGPDAGQSVFHLHMHFLAGKKMLDL